MRFTDLSIRSLPYDEGGQKDYPDTVVRGLSLRVGKRTKTFMLTVRRGERKTREALGRFPECSLSHARELARDKLAEARVSKSTLPSIKFVDALESFYRIHGQEQRESTRIRCRYYLDKFFRDALGKRYLDTVRPADLAPILDDIESLAVRRNVFAFLQAFFNWCYRRGYLDVVPTARLEKPPALSARDRVLSHAELRAIWDATDDDRDYPRIIRLCLLSGQRIGQWMHVRPEYVSGDYVTWPAAAMKEGKSHTLPLTDTMARLIRPFSWKMNGSAVEQLRRASGVENFRHHDLRRSWATVAADELGIAPHHIDAVLAHASGTQVSRVYIRARHLQPMRDALEAYETWLTARLSNVGAHQFSSTSVK